LPDAARRLVPPLAAVAAVVVVIVLLLVLNGPGHTSGPGPALQPPTPLATTSTPPRATSPSPSATPTRTHRPTPTPTRTAPVDEPSATTTPAVAKAPVTVLNNSRRTGLASRAADQLNNGGWRIAEVGNFTGRIPVSTVYYAPGQQAVAQRLAHQFPAIQRVHPRFSGLPGSGLTLVVTREWPA
jgi:hypothetical protein